MKLSPFYLVSVESRANLEAEEQDRDKEDRQAGIGRSTEHHYPPSVTLRLRGGGGESEHGSFAHIHFSAHLLHIYLDIREFWDHLFLISPLGKLACMPTSYGVIENIAKTLLELRV